MKNGSEEEGEQRQKKLRRGKNNRTEESETTKAKPAPGGTTRLRGGARTDQERRSQTKKSIRSLGRQECINGPQKKRRPKARECENMSEQMEKKKAKTYSLHQKLPSKRY